MPVSTDKKVTDQYVRLLSVDFFIASFVWEVIVLIFFQGTKSRLRSCGAGCCFGAFTLLPCEWGGCHLFTAVLGSGFFIECLVWFGSVHETTFVVPTRKEPVCEKPVKRAGREVWNSVYNTMYDQGSRGNRISSEAFFFAISSRLLCSPGL